MENDPTKLTSFQPLTPVASSSRFSFSKWFDGFTKRKTSQAPNLPPTSEQTTRKTSLNDDKKDTASSTNERVCI